MWKTSLYASGAEVDGRLRTVIEEAVRAGLGGLDGDIGHVHVRVYGDVEPGFHTCYIRADALPHGGIALGATAVGIEEAVARAVARVAAALRGKQGGWDGVGRVAAI